MKEAPHTVELMQAFKNEQVVFLFISIDDSEEMWKKAVKEKNLRKGIHLISKATGENIQREYNINGIPRYFIIDREGKILNLNAARPSDEKTAELLKNALRN